MRFTLIFFIAFCGYNALSQTLISHRPPLNWQLMDWQKEGYRGISVEKAYNQLLNHKKPLKKIIVAIIDDGFDTTHPDLVGMEWTNKKEIPGNNIDDDNNGFTDDVHGWNFVGNVRKESLEEIREYIRLRSRFENKDSALIKADPLFNYWQRILDAKNIQMNTFAGADAALQKLLNSFYAVQHYWSTKLSLDSVSFIRLKQELPPDADSETIQGRAYILSFKDQVDAITDSATLLTVIRTSVQPYFDENKRALGVAEKILEKNDAAYFRRSIMQDDPYVNNKTEYGNDNTFPNDPHGTECAGIIAALRNNGTGGNGITNSVAIMPIRINAMGHIADEWDKDVANAIKYAVDNGAQVISMSFGKYYSPQKEWVRSAIKYAAQKGVLLVHAAMNSSLNTDSIISYPQEYYSLKEQAKNLINVGASTYDSSLVADFSNYGNKTVDVFAPGTNLYMPVLHGGYEWGYGTSFACPIVAGLAALIWSYYPKLNYLQVRYCIEKSAKPIHTLVTKPGTQEKVPFSTLSKTGGIVNAYEALMIAEKIRCMHP